MGTIRELFEWCSAELARPYATTELERLVTRSPELGGYGTAAGLVRALQGIDRDAPSHELDQKDVLLRCLVSDFQRGVCRRLISNILILAFARRLAALAERYCRWDDDGEGVSQLVGALLESAASYPLARRPVKISANLALETEKRLTKRLARERRQQQLEAELTGEVEQAFAAPAAWESGADFGWSADDAPAVLIHLEQLGVIDRTERELIETTAIYGWKLTECISAGLWGSAGLTYKAAHNRLTRALKRIRNGIAAGLVTFPEFDSPQEK